MYKWGTQQNVIRGEPPWGPTPPFTFYIPLLPEKVPLFLIPFFDKWYPFHISINQKMHLLALLGLFTNYINHKMHLLALLGLFTNYINHKMHLLALLGLFTNYINHKMHLLALLGLFTNYINHKMHLLALLGLFTDYHDRFPYPFMYFNKWNYFPFIYQKLKKVPLFGRGSLYRPLWLAPTQYRQYFQISSLFQILEKGSRAMITLGEIFTVKDSSTRYLLACT